MNRKIFVPIIFFAIFLILFACDNDEQCRKDNYVMMKIGFYKSVIDSLGKQKNSENSVKVTVKGADRDLFIYKDSLVTSIALPLNKLTNFSTFEISFNDTLETFTVWHTNIEEYLSFECGYLTTFTIDSIQNNGFYTDSISLINKSVNTQNAENTQNFQFYRHYDYRK